MTSGQRYRTNPQYRERQIARVRKRHEQRSADPNYARLIAVRKKIVERRDSIEIFLKRIASLERDLFKLIAERDKLAGSK